MQVFFLNVSTNPLHCFAHPDGLVIILSAITSHLRVAKVQYILVHRTCTCMCTYCVCNMCIYVCTCVCYSLVCVVSVRSVQDPSSGDDEEDQSSCD